MAASHPVNRLVMGNELLARRAHRCARPYLGGETLEEALATLARLRAEGFDVGIDYFGEGRTDPVSVEAATRQYVELNRGLGELDAGVNVWIDLTNVGLDVSDDLCRRQLARIVETLPRGSRLQVRAHDSSRTDRIIDLAIELSADGAAVMPTLQANLRRSPDYAERLIEAGLPVLLVKGAHLEPPAVAYAWGEETDVALVGLAHQLNAGGVEVGIATHDPVIREALIAAIPGIGVEMLLGVRSADARELLGRGHRVRLYVPFGSDWLRYWLRRLGEARGAG